jgi:hypothetical protein
MNPAHTLMFSLRPILILFFYPCLGLASGPFHSGFLTKMSDAFLISPARAVYPAHLIHLDLLALIIDY